MIARLAGTRWTVRLSVGRRGGWRTWGLVSGRFEERMAAQASTAILSPQVDSETRRGHDYVRVTIAMTVVAADVAEAVTAAWRTFRKAAGDDIKGWDLASTAAEVQPEGELTEFREVF